MAKIVVLIPAHNEENSIGGVLDHLILQERPADLIVVAANGCKDATISIVKKYDSVVLMDLPQLEHRKSQALNIAWEWYAKDADLVICLDADTNLPPNAILAWEKEFENNTNLGGSRAKFTMNGSDVITRLQKHEYAQGVDNSLRRGWTSILAGAGCMLRNTALIEIASTRQGPWSYESQVEDYELTYQLRSRDLDTHVSPTVRAYTDSMKSVRALWKQRMKWQVGTTEDLLRIGWNRHTRYDWGQQALGFACIMVRILWLGLTAFAVYAGAYSLQWYWMLMPFLYIFVNLRTASRIPHRDVWDYALAIAIVPHELFSMMQMGWFSKGWASVIADKIFNRQRRDLWALQYQAEKGGNHVHKDRRRIISVHRSRAKHRVGRS